MQFGRDKVRPVGRQDRQFVRHPSIATSGLVEEGGQSHFECDARVVPGQRGVHTELVACVHVRLILCEGTPRMTTYESTLTLAFGAVDVRSGRRPFRLRLETGLLADLIRATQNAHRIYELLLIDRPGDVWDYVWVVLEALPQRTASRVALARQRAQPEVAGSVHPWPDDRLPFKVFDSLFDWASEAWACDDIRPEEEGWLIHRNSESMRLFSKQVLSIAREARWPLENSVDHLLRHVVSRVKSGDDPHCYLDREGVRNMGRKMTSNNAQHTPGFYEKLRQILGDAELSSIAYLGDGDDRVLRMMATEQRRRANLTGHRAGNALRLEAIVNNQVSNKAWDSDIWFIGEGFPLGDLLIVGDGLYVSDLKESFLSCGNSPGKFLLSWRDEGSIDGFTAKAGEGWVLYTRQSPGTRRMALERIEFRRGSSRVLSFADNGATLYDYEKAVVVVGAEEVSAAAQSALALVLTEWQRSGGDPVLVVVGDPAPFDRTGFKDVVSVPADAGDDKSLADWLDAELHRSRPWVDAVIALHAPGWASQVLARRQRRQYEPWPAWVVATKGEPDLKVDHWLEGDLEQALLDAHHRARSTTRWA